MIVRIKLDNVVNFWKIVKFSKNSYSNGYKDNF